MNKGAVCLRVRKGKWRRLRRASFILGDGECVKLYYDENLLSMKAPLTECLHNFRYYSVGTNRRVWSPRARSTETTVPF
jgi:hypothetical protein